MNYIPQSITRNIGNLVLSTKKNSPHIFFIGGIAGVITSTVLACKATLKLEETVDDIRDDISTVNEGFEKNIIDQSARNKHLIHIYVKGGLKLGRLYGPSIAIGTASIAALTGSHVQLTRRNSALTATLTLVSRAFDDYRDRVREELGEEKELDVYYGAKEETLEIDGKKTKVKTLDPNALSQYARFFDECSTRWTKDPEVNRMIVQCQQNYYNQQLQARGHVFLNEVYDSLGLERSRAGQVVGWILDGEGDGYVDFGIFEPQNSRFINNIERSILLDFNVDGVIYDKALKGDK